MSAAAWPALVLVEGMPGSGKSTTAQWLAGELEHQGRPARWVYEGEVPHPVVDPPSVLLRDWKEILGRHFAGWSRFAAALRAEETVVVVESAFLQRSVAAMLRRNLDGEIIRTFVARIADIIRPLDPALVYFHARDPISAFRAICDERGMAWTLQHIGAFDGSAWARMRGESGMGGVLAYWREHAAICDAVATGAGLRTLIVGPEVSDWPSRRRHIAAFLGLMAEASPAVVVPDLARFVGTYRDARGRKALLSIHDSDLAVEGLLWHRTRLVPRSPSIFEAESLPFRLTFEDDPSGGVARLHLEGPDLPHTRLAGVYEKLD
jgi:adenylylsulfate kinase-like enzyme